MLEKWYFKSLQAQEIVVASIIMSVRNSYDLWTKNHFKKFSVFLKNNE